MVADTSRERRASDHRHRTRRKEHRRLERRFRRLESVLPGWIGGGIRSLREPGLWLLRVPVALLLIGGGFMGFLPVLGFWMLPLGLLLLALDLPFLKAPVARTLVQAERRWRVWRRSRRGGG